MRVCAAPVVLLVLGLAALCENGNKMTKRMLIDATHKEEIRVAITDGNKLVEYDYESQSRKPLKGNIFLAKVTRVEPSLQAAFVSFGGNRHGFLPFSEIHPDYFKIPIADREALMAEQEALIKQHDEQEALEDDEDIEGDLIEEDSGVPGDIVDGDILDQDIVDEVVELGDDLVENVDDLVVCSNNTDIDSVIVDDLNEDAIDVDVQKGEAQSNNETCDEDISVDEIDVDSIEDSISESDEISLDDSISIIDDNISDIVEKDFDVADENIVVDETENDLLDNDKDISDSIIDADSEVEEDINSKNIDKSEDGKNGGLARKNNRRRPGYRGRVRDRRRYQQYKNKNVEVVGGEDLDEEQRFRFNLRRKYKIQEVIKRGQIMLVQINKEERGNKGAAVSTYLSLPGRYCVLMPNSPRGGGVSRKIANSKDRARMREIVKELEVPKGMSVIVRTAGVGRSREEIKRDLDYLMRLWDNIRDLTLKSSAPALVYEEADLIKRAVRDLYTSDIDAIYVAGEKAYKIAKDFMSMIIPSHVDKIKFYDSKKLPLFNRYQIESQINEIGQPEVRLKSGGYLVINPTEALVSVDVNSGKATKGRHIEETALKTNLEAADELARQLRLRDLGGLVVVDFIDMDNRGNNAKVERRMREALSSDRARIQVGRISSFGLMELSRQRLSPSLIESQFEQCHNCGGVGLVRTADAMSILVLRAIEDEGIRRRAAQIIVRVSANVALYILNHKRRKLAQIEERYNMEVLIRIDDNIAASEYKLEVSKPAVRGSNKGDNNDVLPTPTLESLDIDDDNNSFGSDDSNAEEFMKENERTRSSSRRRGRRGGRNRNSSRQQEDVQSQEKDLMDDKENLSDVNEEDIAVKENINSGDIDGDKVDGLSDAINDNSDKKEDDKEKQLEEKPKKTRRARRSNKKKDDDVIEENVGESEIIDINIDDSNVNGKDVKNTSDGDKEDENLVAKESEDINNESSYEIVNQPPKKKKKGWWNRR